MLKAQSIVCSNYGQIIGLNKFVVGQEDKLLFFDTPNNALYHTKLWNKGYNFDNFTWSVLSSNLFLQRTSTGLGLHHEVITTLRFELKKKQFAGKCFSLFAEHITQSFFVDIYEIERQFLHQVYYNSSIDIEKTAYEAANHTFLIVKELQYDNQCYEARYKLPWHLRYHKPAVNKYVHLTLPIPEIYVGCFQDESKDASENLGNSVSRNLVLAPCPNILFAYNSQYQKMLCEWVKISQISVEDVVFSWPLGIISDQLVVTVTTLTVIIFSTLYLMRVLLKAVA